MTRQARSIALAAAVMTFLALPCLADRPPRLPRTTVAMNDPSYWLLRHPAPDTQVLSSAQIEKLNAYTRDTLRLVRDVTAVGPVYAGAELTAACDDTIGQMRKRHLFRADGTPADDTFYGPLLSRMAPDTVPPEITVGYGVVVWRTDLRLLPTTDALCAGPGRTAVDRLQNSGLEIGTPLAILHASSDGEWWYVLTPLSAGWIATDAAATCTHAELRNHAHATDFIVVTEPEAVIYAGPCRGREYGPVRMGTVLPVRGAEDRSTIPIAVPFQSTDGSALWARGYLRTCDVSRGFLPYTPRTIVEQAFKLLDTPYGWGDVCGARDCSRLIQEVFATVGVTMPRDSSAQEAVGVLIPSLADAVGGITTLKLDGHIMLYLGEAWGEPYAIHALRAYREPSPAGERLRVVDRVVVSDLALGSGSRKGSLAERLTAIRKITLP